MTKLISGRVKKIPSANVSASRYDFIRLSETEPDLGVPAANGYILTANVDGTRHWVPITPSEATTANFATTAGSANTAVFATTAGSANISLRANVATQADAANTALTATFATNSNTANTATFATSSSSANTALRANVATQADAANTALTATFATSSTSANTALRANVATLADTANTSLFAENSTTANTVLSISNFTTSNLAEGTNLYYTNARVHSNVVSALSTYTGNIGAGNVTIGSGTGGSLTGANLISAVYISAQNWEGLYTTNVIEGANLYYTTARANAAITLLVDKPFVDSLGVNASTLDGLDSTAFALDTDLTTANVTELNNLYYTNSRVDSFVTPKLTTANVTELNNLYYTNSRVESNVVNLLPTYSGNINAAYVTATKYFGDGSSLTGVAATAFSGNTDGIVEGTTNLFYTNSRVRSGISLSTTDPTVLSYNSANGNFAFNLSAVTTDGIAEGTNLYYTNSRVRTAISAGTGVDIDPLLGTISIGQNVATTANVTFGALNVTGPVNFYSNVTTYSSNNLSVSDNMIYLNAGSESSNPDLGIAFNYNDGSYHHAGFFRDASDGIFKVYDNYAPEPDANIFIDTSDASFRLANLSATTFFGNVQGTVSTLSNFTTSDLAEGTNKYFSNALARNALSAGDSTIIYDPIAGTIRATANVTATIESTVNNLSTANVTEAAGNLYYTNARVYSNVLALLPTLAGDNITISANGRISANASSTVLATTVVGLNTANVSESNSNLYYTNARVYSNTLALLPTLAGDNISIAANGRISANTSAILGSITSLSGNIALTGNLLATNGIFAATGAFTGNVAAGNIVTAGGQGGSITGANLLSANNVSATNWIGLYTANVIETSGNLYFTNARVLSNVTAYLAANPITSSYSNANVASYLTSYTGNIQAGNVIANSFISTAPGTGTLTATGDFNIVSGGNIRLTGNVYANTFISTATGAGSLTSTSDFNIIAAGNVSITAPNVLANGTVVANRITANLWSGIYTANVIESASGLYYTNSRVLSNVTAYLAANPISSSYGNANVGSYLASYTGNINAGNIIANAIIAGQGLGGSITGANLISANNISASVITANTIIGGGSGGSVTGANLISTNNISAVNWIGLYTANVVESGSLFYTNSRVYSNVLALLPTLAGDNITIAANGRISATVSATVNVSSIVGLTTANITELNNLYYTNARVLSNVTAYLAANPVTASYGNANVGAYLTTYTGNINAGNVVANAIIAGTGLGGSITGANLISANNISASVITANTIVGAGTGGSITGANLISTNNISSVNWLGLYTANVVETSGNLYFTNARVVSALSAGSGIAISANGQISTTTTLTANAVTGLNTANVNEFGSNLYYTNARVLSNVTAYLAANPVTSSFGNANVASYLTTYTGNVNAGNVIANSFVATTTGTGTLTATGDFNIVSGGNIRLTGNVYSNTFISTATGAGSITSTSDFNINAAGNVNITANNIITSGNINAGNLILTGGITDRVGVLSITTTGGTNANIELTANGTGRILLDGMAWPLTDGVDGYVLQTNGTGNLFWAAPATSSYGNANVGAYLTTYTGNISAGNVIANTLITGSGSGGSFTGANLISAGNISATTWLNLYTANVIESGNNIFYTNTRVYSNVIALLPTLAGNNITIDANGRISATVSATVNVSSIVGLTTANVAEVGSNLYFTNTRVISALSAGEGITLAANGQISGGVHAITNSQTFAGGNANITLATSVSEAKRIIVTIDGLVQIPVTDYTVSGTTLTLIPTPSPNSTIEVKFFGNEAITTQTFNPFLLAGL